MYNEFNGMATDSLHANPRHGFQLDELVAEIERIYLFG